MEKITFGRIAEYILDTIAPPDPLVRRIERMSPADFLEKVARAEIPADHVNISEQRANGVRAIFKYKDPLAKAAILELKSYGNKKMSRLLAALLYEELPRDMAHPIVIPIPITRKSLRERGWNQCELVGRALEVFDQGKRFELRTDLLEKIRQTDDQVGKGREERFENLRDCFGVREPDQMRGRDVIIFDDILTTGATLGEAAKACKNAGAATIFCIALAH
ncbi:MAG TPA: phosphoribosyltransferase family protein [Candidatus Paceibacterota bacterium]